MGPVLLILAGILLLLSLFPHPTELDPKTGMGKPRLQVFFEELLKR